MDLTVEQFLLMIIMIMGFATILLLLWLLGMYLWVYGFMWVLEKIRSLANWLGWR